MRSMRRADEEAAGSSDDAGKGREETLKIGQRMGEDKIIIFGIIVCGCVAACAALSNLPLAMHEKDRGREGERLRGAVRGRG